MVGVFEVVAVPYNPDGWGPPDSTAATAASSNLPLNVPFAPFSRSDKLGRIADWTRTINNPGRPKNASDAVFDFTNDDSFPSNADEDMSFRLVDGKPPPRPKFGPKWRFNQQRTQLPQRRDEEVEAKKREAEKERARRDRLYNINRSNVHGPRREAAVFKSSVEIQPEWNMLDQIPFSTFSKLSFSVPEPEDLLLCGGLEFYDRTFDRTTPKNERRLERFKNRNFFKVTTTDDPVIRRLANEDKATVFITDAILSTLMCATRSVYSWDIVVQRVGNKLFFDKRDGSQLDLLSVHETSQEPLPEAKDDINSAYSLSVEAAYINQNFSQQVLVRDGNKVAFDEPNPFANEGEEVASVAYRYRRWKLDMKNLILQSFLPSMGFSSSSISFFFFLFLFLFPLSSFAEIRFTEIRNDNRLIIPFDTFGFSHTGRLELNVSTISLSISNPDLDFSKAGFFLCTRESWLRVYQQLEDGEISCALQSDLVKPVYTFNLLKGQDRFDLLFTENDADQYTLLFANCLRDLRVSMDVRSAMYNLEGKNNGRDYLSAGKTILPRIYFVFSLIYFSMAALWIHVLYRKRLTVHGIHFFMLAVLILKAVNLLCEAEDKSYIKRTGSAHGWDVLFYIFSFLKGITLFTLIVLIGTGWSFLKPYLQDKEKKVLMIVIPLQVVANIAQVVIDETGPFAQEWFTWKQVFLLVDVICCCAVLFPIVWSIKNLREAARTDGKAAVNLMKLTLFRQYYIVVICYIYFTRVVVYALETITSYRYLWTSVVAAELGTLAFYAFTGYKFRPEAHNPYFVVDDEEEEAAAEALKLEDEFEL